MCIYGIRIIEDKNHHHHHEQQRMKVRWESVNYLDSVR